MLNIISHCVLSCFSPVQLFATLWTVACQAPLFMGFSRQEYWSGLPCPSTGNFPHPGIKPRSPASSAFQADSLPLVPPGKSLTPSPSPISPLRQHLSTCSWMGSDPLSTYPVETGN